MSLVLGVLVWMALVMCPTIGFALAGAPSAADVALHDESTLLLPTAAWTGGIALAAVITGRLAAGGLQRGSRWWSAPVLAAALMPPAAVFWIWFASADAGSLVGSAAIEGGWTWALRRGLLALALTSTIWPLAAFLLARGQLRTPESVRALQMLDGMRVSQRLAHRWRIEWPSLLAAGALCAAAVSMSTTAFDLAAQATAGTELRARLALGAGTSAVWGVWLISAAPALAGALAAWWALGRRPARIDRAVGGGWALLGVLTLTLGAPLVVLVLLVRNPDAGLIPATLRALSGAVLVGLLAGGLLWLFVPLLRSDRWVRWTTVLGLTWLLAALLPRAWVAAGWAKLQQLLPECFAQAGIGRLAALLLPAGALSLLTARLIVRSEARARRDLLAMDAPPWWWPTSAMRRGAWCVVALSAAWSLFAPAVESRLAPPAQGPPLVTQLVDAMHYQRPESVVAVLWVIAAAAVLAGLAACVHAPLRRSTVSAAAVCALMIVIPGCESGAPSDAGPAPLPVVRHVGGSGTGPGRFVTPRAADAGEGVLVVVDRSGRLQRFGAEHSQVELPLLGNGFPTGVQLLEDGRALVADTHGSRVLEVDPGGGVSTIVGGAQTGLVSPTDVAVGPDGLLYVSEYGQDDRILVCCPDGDLVRTLGGSGSGPGQYRRPQALAFDASGGLWVADACNHRLQLIDPESGDAIDVIEGIVRYPYGVDVLADGDLLVSEYGGNVLRRIDPATRATKVWGGWGDAPGRLRTPWSVAIDHHAGVAWVVDTGHDRVVAVDLETLAW